jgi:hypothetical protein
VNTRVISPAPGGQPIKEYWREGKTRAMVRYYLRLLGHLPRILRKMAETVVFWTGVIFFFFGYYSPEIARGMQLEAGSRWMAVVPIALLVVWGLLKENYNELVRASRPGETRIFNPPLYNVPVGYYKFRLQEEEREHYERLKVENASLKRQLGLSH